MVGALVEKTASSAPLLCRPELHSARRLSEERAQAHMNAFSKFLAGLLLVLSFCAPSGLCQPDIRSPRIVDKIDENQLVMLKGNTPPPANAKNDHGRVNPNMRMTDLLLVEREAIRALPSEHIRSR